MIARVIIGGRAYTSGDRVIARRNDRRRDVDNGTLATIIAIDRDQGSMLLEADSGEPLAPDHDYVAPPLRSAPQIPEPNGVDLLRAGGLRRSGRNLNR